MANTPTTTTPAMGMAALHKLKHLITAAALATLALAPAAHADTGRGNAQFLSIIHEHIFGLTADNGDAG